MGLLPSLRTPVVLLIYHRPQTTRQVFARVREARPETLLVIADGPRPGDADDAAACRAAREVAEAVDWPCRVLRQYAATNLGLRERFASGLGWAFSQVEEAIILEDDCLPEATFFAFCEELLARYRSEPRVMMLSGNDMSRQVAAAGGDSYRFTRYAHIWGWATWRRAWQQYDPDMCDWPRLRTSGWLEKILGDRRAVRYWTRLFDDTHAGRINTWDYQWQYSCWRAGALSVEPHGNLVSNIGFGALATHTGGHNPFAALPTQPMRFPLVHPPGLSVDSVVDRERQTMRYPSVVGRLRDRVRLTVERLLAGRRERGGP